MGGKAFSNTLSTPRMPVEVYLQVRGHTLSVLRTHFYRCAETPTEAPGKLDYGDIDILVCGPFDEKTDLRIVNEKIAGTLGAKEWKRLKGSATTNFAVYWPEAAQFSHGTAKSERSERTDLRPKSSLDEATSNSSLEDESQTSSHQKTERFIQLDIHLSPTPTRLKWEIFHQSHGDFWNIIGGMIRSYGLTVSNSGFYVRIEELETWNKEVARVKMTEDPVEVLRFLGIEESTYFSTFPTVDALCAYATTCHFFRPRTLRLASESVNSSTASDVPPEPNDLPTFLRTLKSNDRRRFALRNIFKYWIEEYLPNSTSQPGKLTHLTRDEVVEECKKFYGPEFAKEYDGRKKTWVWKMRSAECWARVRKELVETVKAQEGEDGGIEWGYVFKGLKGCVVVEQAGEGTDGEGDAAPNGTEHEDTDISTVWGLDISSVRKAYATGDFETVFSWCIKYGKDVGQMQKEIDRVKSGKKLAEHYAKEAEKKRLEEE